MSERDERSIIERFRALPVEKRRRLLAGYSDEQLAAMRYDWQLNARPKQLPPPGDWRHWLILSGRGFGKTRTGAEWVIDRARRSPPGEGILLVGQTKDEVRRTMLERGESSLFKVSPPWFMPRYVEDSAKKAIVWPNGATAEIIYGDTIGQGRGPNSHTIWVDEFAKFQYPEELWKESINLSLRQKSGAPFRCQVLFTTTPRPIQMLKELVAHPRSVITTGSSYENMANLDEDFREELIHTYEGTRLGRQEVYGEILDDHPGALWCYTDLDNNRLDTCPKLDVIAVGVDPSVSDTDGSDECGIVAKGRCSETLLDGRTHYVTIADVSGKMHVREWSRKAVGLARKLADDHGCVVVIIAEVNQGGDLVTGALKEVDPTIRVITNAELDGGKWWNKSKEAKAEPVALLAEQGRDHHIGTFPKLEDEMCTWEPGQGMPSPNRFDAHAWAGLYLLSHSPLWGVFI